MTQSWRRLKVLLLNTFHFILFNRNTLNILHSFFFSFFFPWFFFLQIFFSFLSFWLFKGKTISENRNCPKTIFQIFNENQMWIIYIYILWGGNNFVFPKETLRFASVQMANLQCANELWSWEHCLTCGFSAQPLLLFCPVVKIYLVLTWVFKRMKAPAPLSKLLQTYIFRHRYQVIITAC